MRRLIVFSFVFIVAAPLSYGAIHRINDQLLKLENEKYQDGVLAEGVLANTTDIQFGINVLKKVPRGTLIKVSALGADKMFISLMVFTTSFEDQVWKAGLDTVHINCSPYVDANGSRARVVVFYSNLQMDGRCTAVGGDSISTPDGGRVLLGEGALVFFTKRGLLKSATNVAKGKIYIFGQEVEVLEGSFLDYNKDENLHFVYLKGGESFSTPTILSPTTVFKQPLNERNWPFVFYPSGNVDSGRVYLDGDLSIGPLIFGEVHEIDIQEGQMGFDEFGRLNRMISKQEVVVKLENDVKIVFISSEDRTSVSTTMKAGENFVIPEGMHLFLSYKNNKLVLDGFPVVIEGKKYFLSLNGEASAVPSFQ